MVESTGGMIIAVCIGMLVAFYLCLYLVTEVFIEIRWLFHPVRKDQGIPISYKILFLKIPVLIAALGLWVYVFVDSFKFLINV